MTKPIVVSVAGVGLLLLHALTPAPVPIHLRVAGALPGVAALILWWRYFVARELDRFPFLEYAVTQLYLYWGLATITLRAADMPDIGGRALAGAVMGACVVTASVLVAHPMGRLLGASAASPLERCLPRSAPALTPLIVVPWLGVAAAVHAEVGAGIVPSTVYHLVGILGDYSPLLAAIAWRDLREGRRSPSFVACTACVSLAGLLTGMMEAVVQPVLTAITLHVVFQRRIPWRLIGAGMLIVVVVNPAKHRYREMASWDEGGGREMHAVRDPLLAAERWWKALQAAWTSGDSDRAGNAAGLASRVNELSINAIVLEKTPASVPFDGGKSWGYMGVSLAPRFLYPDKPNFTHVFNDRFSVVFGFQTPEATEISTAAFPLVADGYWNFGWPGVVLVGLVTGCMIGVFSGALRARSWATASIAAACFVQLHATSCLAAQVVGVLQQVVGMAIVLWVVWAVSGVADRAARSLRRRVATAN